MRSPYQDLPDRAFWRSSVGRDDAASLAQLWTPKAGITRETALMTIGSCFAQHLHRALVRGGWNVLQGEDMSAHLPTRLCHRYGYNLFSGRYGNVYTARQFRQLIEQAISPAPAPGPIWEKDGRFYDALRPTVEPEGLGHPDEVMQSRREHLVALRGVLERAECIILTLGLTEGWIDSASGYALPTAPGTVAGDHDPARATFHNFTQTEVMEDLRASRDLLRAHGCSARFVLTVSPVPLVATASGDHVASATAYSKAVLRAACGELQMSDPDFDYFPAYEIVTTTIARGPYLDQFARQPTDEGVQLVLKAFSLALGAGDTSGKGAEADSPAIPPTPLPTPVDDDTICEEILLEAFRK